MLGLCLRPHDPWGQVGLAFFLPPPRNKVSSSWAGLTEGLPLVSTPRSWISLPVARRGGKGMGHL